MLSVVMATCNGARFVDAQLDSIAGQLQPDDEIVVSDDASTDDTAAMIERRADERIRLIANSTRVGYVRNFERAIAQARGKYVFFSDQDDIWLPGKVQAITAALQGSACVASDARVVDESLRELHPSYFAFRQVRSFSALAILVRPPIVGATLACQRSYLRSLLPVPAGVSHDFWITFNAAADRALQVLPSKLILYRRHPSVTSLTALGGKRAFTQMTIERARLLGAWGLRHTGYRPRGGFS